MEFLNENHSAWLLKLKLEKIDATLRYLVYNNIVMFFCNFSDSAEILSHTYLHFALSLLLVPWFLNAFASGNKKYELSVTNRMSQKTLEGSFCSLCQCPGRILGHHPECPAGSKLALCGFEIRLSLSTS